MQDRAPRRAGGPSAEDRRGSRRYGSRGFTCRGTFDDEGLPTVRWRCTRAKAVIRFERS